MTVQRLEAELGSLLAKLDGKARRVLARKIAKNLQASQRKRIAAQQNPDGSAFAPRLPQFRSQKGRIRRTMFAKLRATKYLKVRVSQDAAVVGFVSHVERIASVHQFGLRDRPRAGVPEVQYAARQLLGFSDADLSAIYDETLAHLSS